VSLIPPFRKEIQCLSFQPYQCYSCNSIDENLTIASPWNKLLHAERFCAFPLGDAASAGADPNARYRFPDEPRINEPHKWVLRQQYQ